MEYRTFGSTGLKVSRIGFGCARLGGFFSNLTRAEMQEILHQALDTGINFYDTSDMYSQGESEKVVGEAFSRQRDRVIIASKTGYVLPGQRRLISRIKPLVRPIIKKLGLKRENLPVGVRGELTQNFSPGYITQAIEQSLKRLKTDYLDLYQLHSPPTAILEQGEALETLAKLKKQGKIRFFGVSCERIEDALICLNHPGLSSLQLRFNLLDQSALEQAIPLASKNGVGIIARECFAGGLLAKSPESLKIAEVSEDPEVAPRRYQQILDYATTANQNNLSLRQQALYFILEQPGISVALLGMTTQTQLKTNLAMLTGKPPLNS